MSVEEGREYERAEMMERVGALGTPTEPVFVNLLRSPGIDSQPDGPVRQPDLSYRPATEAGGIESSGVSSEFLYSRS
jgi:hypothetical protein